MAMVMLVPSDMVVKLSAPLMPNGPRNASPWPDQNPRFYRSHLA